MEQPPGYGCNDRDAVCWLQQSLYGFKQGARVWHQCINGVLKDIGFQRSNSDPCLYTRRLKGRYAYVLIYVDDIITACH